MIYVDSKIQIYNLVIIEFTINNKYQIVITTIKSRIYYLICIVLASKYKILYKDQYLQIPKKLQA